MFDYFITAIIYSAILYLLLWLGNINKPQRGMQVLDFIVAFILVIVAVIFLKLIITPLLTFIGWILGLFSVTFSTGSLFAYIIYGLTIILIYAIFKIVYKLFLVKRVYSFIASHFPGSTWPYLKEDDNTFVLTEKWCFLKSLSKSAIIVSLIVYLSFLVVALLLPTPVNLPPLLTLTIFLILEIFFYLDGLVQVSLSDQVEGEDARYSQLVNFNNLWEEYQKIWPDKVLYGYRYVNPAPSGKTFHELSLNEARLLFAKGFKITATDEDILDLSINKDRDLILDNIAPESFAPVLSTIINHKLVEGKNVLVLLPTENSLNEKSNYGEQFRTWLNNWLKKINGDVDYWGGQYYNKLSDSNPEICKDIILSTADQLLDKNTLEDKWFNELGLIVIFLTLDDFQSNLAENKILLRIIDNSKRSIQLLVLSKEYKNLQDAVERNLELRQNKSERSYIFDTPEESTYTLIWKAEGDKTFHSRVFVGDTFEHLDIEPVLALPSIRDFIEHVELINNGKQTLEESCEELLRKREHIRQEILDITEIDSYLKKIRIPTISDLSAREPLKVMFVRDVENNVITTFKKWSSFGEKSIFINIVSLPYLLREYFVDNFDYFIKSPVYPISPKLFQSEFNTALEILLRLLIKPVSSDELLNIIHQVDHNPDHPLDYLTFLFKRVFNIDENTIKIYLQSKEGFEFVHDEAKDCFRTIHYYNLDYSIMNKVRDLWFLRRVKIEDDSGTILKETDFDHLFQDYLPGQIVTLNGRPYKIRSFDEKSFTLHVDFCTSEKFFLFYKNSLNVKVEKLETIRTEEKDSIRKVLLTGNFEIKTLGYFQFLNDYTNDDKDYSYYPLKNVIPSRKYLHGRAFGLELKPGELDNLVSPDILTTLVLLLSELMKTLFPSQCNYLLIGIENQPLPKEFDFLFTRLSVKTVTEDEKKQDNTISAGSRIIFIEDSVQDLGLVSALFDNIEYALKIIDDFICWHLEPKSTTTLMNPIIKGDVRNGNTPIDGFLKFGNNSLPKFLDLKNTHDLLVEILKQNELYQSRKDFYSGKQNIRFDNVEKHICDFCGNDNNLNSLDIFEDGRERCQKCKESAVNTIEELENVYSKGKEFLSKTFSLNLLSGITVKFTDAKTIQQSIGKIFVPTPDFDPRPVGLATNDEGVYTIYIENGTPYISTLATIIHELTHIWQFSSINMKKMDEETSNLLAEGHAVWSSIEVLKKNGFEVEARNYHNHYLERQDEYGIGYKIILQRCTGQNPFEYLLKYYPKPA